MTNTKDGQAVFFSTRKNAIIKSLTDYMPFAETITKTKTQEMKEIGEDKITRPRLEIVPTSADVDMENITKTFKPILEARETQYDLDVEKTPQAAAMRANLEVHNRIVLGYAAELIDQLGLSKTDRVAAILATIEHDAGKLASGLLEHHAQGVKYARELLDEKMGQSFEGVKITPEIKQSVLQAVERHMNHPFLVKMHGGERFPEPQTDVDRVVFDADMMANAGFKNVAFRLSSEQFLATDKQTAATQGVSALEACFDNVMQGVGGLTETVLSAPARETTATLVDATKRINRYFKDNGIFKQIQDTFSDAQGNFDIHSISQVGGLPMIKKIINEKVLVAAAKLGIEKKHAQNFML